MTDSAVAITAKSPTHEDPFRAVRDELLETPADELARQLPNLVAAVSEAARMEDSERLVIGVSFTRDHTPLDYELERIVEGADERRELLVEPVSPEHRYVRFPYPPDPGFTATALKGALLCAIERELDEQESPETTEEDTTSDPTSTLESVTRRLKALL